MGMLYKVISQMWKSFGSKINEEDPEHIHIKEPKDFTMSLGITPSSLFESDKPNFEVIGMYYDCRDGNGGLVYIKISIDSTEYYVRIPPEQCISLGFINLHGIKDYCKI